MNPNNYVSIATTKEAKAPNFNPDNFGCCRRGTCRANIVNFANRFGNPHEQNTTEDGIDGAGKIHYVWYIHTPRGTARIQDYWWNGENELSVVAGNNKIASWVGWWLRKHGLS